MKPRVVLGFLGSTLDQGKNPDRWKRWRPTVAMCQHDDFLIDRLELLHAARHTPLAQRIVKDISQVSPETDVTRHRVEMADPWDFEEVYGRLHEFARNYAFDTDAEDYLVNITTGTHVAQICWFLLTEARAVPGRLLQLTPPKRWNDGSPGRYGVIDLDLSRYDRIAMRFKAEQTEATSFLKSGIETKNPAFNHMISRIEHVAIKSVAPLLLTGPTGAGKSQLARRIFELKHTRHQVKGAFVEVNCATLRGDQAMSALFGHVKGAFTGANTDRPGLLKAANGGVLFLDEIGELGLDEQAMILRAIEERRFLPVGSDQDSQSDFQLIAGTNRDLQADVMQGRFREDLLARLNLWIFRLPGLRERREDIEPNLSFELQRYAETNGDTVTFNKEARERYLSFATSPDALWLANFRDLGASVTRMGTLAHSGRITEAIVMEEIERLKGRWRRDEPNADATEIAGLIGRERLEDIDLFDQAQLATVIRVCRQSRSMSEAGRKLFAVSRLAKASNNDTDRLKKYLVRYGLGWSDIRENDGGTSGQ
ncbi:MAG: sigma 54-interacting transcriptional regulator [Hyphomicrobiaceae bacterium]|nr:sigma 54-interacting transcriptional regulator [Hyphomicrobiaceae bacterium]